MDYEIETTALNFHENFNIFRIRRIMLILGKLKNYSSSFGSILLPDSGSQIPSTGNE